MRVASSSHASGRRPAFMHASERNSSGLQRHSTGTCGSRRPRAGPCATMSPSRPIAIACGYSFGRRTSTSSGLDRRDPSTRTRSTSSLWRGGSLGSSHAPSAAFTRALISGKNGDGYPMQPRSSPSGNVFRVTNAPAFSLNRSGTLRVGSGRACTKLSIVSRAIFTARRPSSSEYAIRVHNPRDFLKRSPGEIARDSDSRWKLETYLSRGASFEGGDGMRARVPVIEIMTRTPVTVSPDDTGDRAAATMRTRDIGRIWPHLIEVTREYARLGLDEDVRGIEGHCEACGVYSTNLVLDKKLLVCPDCRGG